MARAFTKSCFRLALECPTKLYYSAHPEQYANSSVDDAFLQALADCGFQVGALARVMHPDGILITAPAVADQVRETEAWLTKRDAVLFEATLQSGDLVARVDILRKEGNRLDIIEVKAKSFDSSQGDPFVGRGGSFLSEWRPYLHDVAFQYHVARRAHPQLEIRAFLMMADKAKCCSVDGLANRFRVRRSGSRATVDIAAGTDLAAIGTPVLTSVDVTGHVRTIIGSRLQLIGQEGSWDDRLDAMAEAWRRGDKLGPVIGAQCGNCEFRGLDGDLASGFAECLSAPLNAPPQDISGGTVLDLWNYRGKTKLIERGVLQLSDVTQDDLNFAEGKGKLSRSERQWMQVSEDWPGGGPFFLDRAYVRDEMAKWTWPLHFIDFETCRTAIPSRKGQAPYVQVAFQFSHHLMAEDGAVEHRTQFLETEPDVDPNLPFLRALKEAVGDEGTVFMWSPHERTVLKALRTLLQEAAVPPPDCTALTAFIDSLTDGPRALYDLCRMAEDAFFHPSTKGSCSIKKVLPAVLKESGFLKQRYGLPFYGAQGGIPSLNFRDQTWWHAEDGQVINPYRLLEPVFYDLPPELQGKLDASEGLEIAEGGAAATAYVRLQFEDLHPQEREHIRKALLRYCELDTLAMVMIVEAWMDWSQA